MGKILNPCVNICKFERGGHCTGCSMTKEQKKILKGLNKKNQKLNFLSLSFFNRKYLVVLSTGKNLILIFITAKELSVMFYSSKYSYLKISLFDKI